MNAQQEVGSAQLPDLVRTLVDHGLLAAEDSERALAVLTGSVPASAARDRRSAIAEITGYVGAILVLAAGAIFVSLRWEEIGFAGQLAALLGSAAALAVAMALAIAAQRAAATPTEADQRRRLASVLGLGASALLAGAVGVWADRSLVEVGRVDSNDVPATLAYLVFTVAAAGVYALAHSAAAQVAIAGGATISAFMLSDYVVRDGVPRTLALFALAIGWLWAAETRRWREPNAGKVVGAGLALIAAQQIIVEDHPALTYAMLGVVGFAGFVLYLSRPHWAYLTLGVAGATLAATEASVDYADGALGAAGALLVSGGMLLATSLLALRLHRTRTEAPTAPEARG